MVQKDKVAIITGGARGIGRGCALRLAEKGCAIVLVDLLTSEMAATKKEIEDLGTDCLVFNADVADHQKAKNIATTVNETFGRIDILVNNAGINGFENRQDLIDERIKVNNLQIKEFSKSEKISTHFDVTVNMSDDEWHKMISVHLNGTFFCTREALTIMNNQESASIINMGSVLGTTGGPSSPHYSAAKAAILGFTRATAKELASRNIRVNAIAPGYINTDMTSGLGDVIKLVKSSTPMKTFGEVNDIAWAAVYLASEEAKFVTGQTMSPNGGFVMSQ